MWGRAEFTYICDCKNREISPPFRAFGVVLRRYRWFCFLLYSNGLVFQDERDFHQYAVFGDVALLIDDDFEIFDPGGFDVLERAVAALDALLDGVVKGFWGRDFDLGHFCDTHGLPPYLCIRCVPMIVV